MDCPHCGKEIKLAQVCYLNVETYRESKVCRTACCQKLVNLSPLLAFRVSKYTGDKTKDAWGQ